MHAVFLGGTTNSSPAQISNLFKKLISRIEMGALLWDKIKNPRKILYVFWSNY